MATTRIIGVGFNIVSITVNTIVFRFPVNIDGFGGTAETHLANITAAVAQVMSNIVTNSNGLMTACDVTDASAWNVTDRFCVTQSATINTFDTGDLAAGAAVDGDICMVTPRRISHGDLMLYTGFNTAWNTTKNIIFRSWSPLLKWDISLTANRVSNSVTGVFFEDVIIEFMNNIQTKNNSTYRRCYTIGFNGLLAGSGATTGSVKSHSCIYHASFNTLLVRTGPATGNAHEHYHMGYSSFDRSDVANLPTGNTVIVANSMLILNDNTTDPFIGAADFSGTTNNWASFNGSLPGSGNLTNKNVDELKLAMFNGPSPSSFLWPIEAPEPNSSPTIIGAGITIAAAHTLIENRRDFMGNLRPTTGAQDMGAFNYQTHDGGVAWVGYREATPPSINIGTRLIVTV